MLTNISGLITFVLELIIVGAIIYAINWFLAQLTLPQPLKYVVLLIVSVIALVWLLGTLGIYHL